MDQRKIKTQQAIQEAFLQLRKEKNLEQISVTELSRLARISKATFYLHYRDIFDLSEKLQIEAIRQILDQIDISSSALEQWPEFIKRMMGVIGEKHHLVEILFSGSQMSMFPLLLENQLRESILGQSQQFNKDIELSIRLTYHVQGSYHAYMRHAGNKNIEEILSIITDFSTELQPQKTCRD
jgi:AcrR family transcriptional regulator